MSISRTLYTLAELNFILGAIDASEYSERLEVARWLSDEDPSSPDPRGEVEQHDRSEENSPEGTISATVSGMGKFEELDWLEFVAFGKWYFTRSDPDPYPSTPHGHLHNADRPWPKLNPYTGRVFVAKHQEDPSQRLKKGEMRELWRTQAFRDFCRSHVVWYAEKYPLHAFTIGNPLRFPRW